MSRVQFPLPFVRKRSRVQIPPVFIDSEVVDRKNGVGSIPSSVSCTPRRIKLKPLNIDTQMIILTVLVFHREYKRSTGEILKGEVTPPRT